MDKSSRTTFFRFVFFGFRIWFKMTIIQSVARCRHLLRDKLKTNISHYSTQGPLGLGKKLSKTEPKVASKGVELPVEKDTKRLAAFVCGTNLFKENGEDVKIKSDSEYPDWLWTLHTGEPLPLSKLDPNTLEYWERVREMAIKERKELDSLYVQNRDYK